MRTSAQMIAKYNARYDPAAQLAARTAVALLAKQNFAEYANDWEIYSNGTRNFLDGQGVSVTNYFGYFAFSNEMYAMLQVCSGESYNIGGSVLIAKYTGQGLSQTVCERLATAVYTWSAAPVGPPV